jgi:hypothetical protein
MMDQFDQRPAREGTLYEVRKRAWEARRRPSADALRASLDKPALVQVAPDGQPADSAHTLAELPDGRIVEAPTTSLAAAKDILAMQKTIERQLAAAADVAPADEVEDEREAREA